MQGAAAAFHRESPGHLLLKQALGGHFRNKPGGLLRELKSGMDPGPKLSRDLTLRIFRALNRIRKPSTADEITELLNRELGSDDRPFRSKLRSGYKSWRVQP